MVTTIKKQQYNILISHRLNSIENSRLREAGESVKTPNWLQAVTPELRELINESLHEEIGNIEEIRLRVNRPLIFRTGEIELTIGKDRKKTSELAKGIKARPQDMENCIEIISQSSLYAWEDELKNGYLTIPGGHRIGLVGRAVLEQGAIKTIKEISGLNYRLGREIRGCGDNVIPFLTDNGKICHTLIVSPPQCGKTTLLRDIIRQLSNGTGGENLGHGVNVGLVDERSEIAGTYRGCPQFDIGVRTDVLDACPKAQGMIMLIRAMSPRVIATDEIGKAEDIEALNQALQSGVSVITTVHGSGFEEISRRAVLKELLQAKFFDRILVLSRRNGPGTLEAVYDGKNQGRLC